MTLSIRLTTSRLVRPLEIPRHLSFKLVKTSHRASKNHGLISSATALETEPTHQDPLAGAAVPTAGCAAVKKAKAEWLHESVRSRAPGVQAKYHNMFNLQVTPSKMIIFQ